MKLNLSKPKTKKFSRDITPLKQSNNKSLDAPSKLNSHFTELSITNSTQIQKRNQRTNSLGYNHAETYLNNSLKQFPFQQSLQKKSLSRKKSSNYFINRSIPSWNKVSIASIPFRKELKKTDNKKNNLILNKISKSTKNNILQHSFVITSSKIHQHLITNSNSNHKEQNTNEYNSENMSNRTEQKQIREIGGKLNQIQTYILNLINNSSDANRVLILEELDKIYKNVLLYTTQHKKVNGNNVNLNVPHNPLFEENIETIIVENENIRVQNKQLNKKMEEIERKCNKVIKDNELLKKDLIYNKEIIDLLQDNVKNINQELLKIKINKGRSSRKVGKIYTIQSEKSLDNINLGDNVNIKAMSKSKRNGIKIRKEIGKRSNNNVLTAPESTNISLIPNTKLHLNLPKPMDFNKEFLDNYEDFSPSYTKQADKMIQKREKK